MTNLLRRRPGVVVVVMAVLITLVAIQSRSNSIVVVNAFHGSTTSFRPIVGQRGGRSVTLQTSTMQREEFELPKQVATRAAAMVSSSLPSSSKKVSQDNNSNSNNNNNRNDNNDNNNNKAWMEQIQSKDIQRVREELIQKFLLHGVTQDVAEREVDSFLHDKTRSQNFVDMRRYAVEKADESLVEGSALLLPGMALLFGGLFVTVIIEFIVKSR